MKLQSTSRLAKAPRMEKRLTAARSTFRRLSRETHGISVVEFALMLPVLVTLGMYGTEIAYMSTVNMQVSQIALSVADNASRLGQSDNSGVDPTIAEADVDAVMFGALKQGESLNFEENGRVVLSSLEADDSTGTTVQFIHWQRCRGGLNRSSLYGDDKTNNGLTGTPIAGVGKAGALVTADPGYAVMVAEVYYDYPGLFGDLFANNLVFRQEAVMAVRDNRDLQDPSQTGLVGGPTQSSCT